MKTFEQGFNIIYEKYIRFVKENGLAGESKLGLSRFLGVTQGKIISWERGQWPAAADLAKIAERLNFSYRWLVTGEGLHEGDHIDQQVFDRKESEISRLENELAILRKELSQKSAHIAELESEVRTVQKELIALYKKGSESSGA